MRTLSNLYCEYVTTNLRISCMHEIFNKHNRKRETVEMIQSLKRKVSYQKFNGHAVNTNIELCYK